MLGTREQPLRRAGFDDAAVLHHGDVVREVFDDAEVVRDEQDGEADVASFALGAGLNNSKPGEIKLLAINNPTRMPQFPNVPTFTEAGINGVLAWFGLFAPKGTPDAIVNRLNAEISKEVMQVDAVRQRWAMAECGGVAR